MVHRPGPAFAPASAPTGHRPVRTCVGCRVKTVAGELLRVVLVGGDLVLDPRRSIAGRGAWIHPDLDCLSKAERRRAFARAFRVPGPLDAGGLRAQLEERLHRETGAGSSRAGLNERKQVDPS